jgi:hypothetical protein
MRFMDSGRSDNENVPRWEGGAVGLTPSHAGDDFVAAFQPADQPRIANTTRDSHLREQAGLRSVLGFVAAARNPFQL